MPLIIALAGVAPTPQTAGGIALDAPWKVTVYRLAQTHFIHPAWGWQHSERNYNMSVAIARADGIAFDSDVLFAACFLHDMAAFAPYDSGHKGMEHGDVAAIDSVDVLRAAGFPMAKIARVQAAERGHMYYSDAGSLPEALLLHDADSLDFLGDIGVARMIALTGKSAPSYEKAVAALRTFVRDIPPRLLTREGKRLGAQRAAELQHFLDSLDAESRGTM